MNELFYVSEYMKIELSYLRKKKQETSATSRLLPDRLSGNLQSHLNLFQSSSQAHESRGFLSSPAFELQSHFRTGRFFLVEPYFRYVRSMAYFLRAVFDILLFICRTMFTLNV